ncbi:glycosyltransferase family 2 protein [Desulfovibrio sp.]|uniref:glycosyltransferase family 2 protein n=1 Tax=Desulfovibrio sp. TaxID=885 RepID=UPI0023CC2ED4|nr:glycosyltransferase family 2 protein [Desulfovibrio sp.]MDE7241142.1 glycosyltransferase family 2 protein [Desulfovibrio sp.]
MISLIIPVYNEEGSLPGLFAAIEQAATKLPELEVILVDDGSSDSSAELLAAQAQKDPRFKVLALAVNRGQTAAIQAGIDHASGDTLVFMDSDLQNDPADIPRLLEKIDEGYDVVSGWRKDRKDNPIKRNFPSRVANALISGISGVRLHDYGCTLKAYRRRALKDVRLYGEMHRFIPIYASWQGAKVAEIPVTHHPRRHGASKYGLERIFKVLLDLLVVKFLSRYLTKPIYVFGGFGFLAFFLSLISLLWALVLKFFFATSLIQTPLPLFAGLCFLLGCMCILMGLLAEVMSRTYFESQQGRPYSIREKINFPPPAPEHDECAE